MSSEPSTGPFERVLEAAVELDDAGLHDAIRSSELAMRVQQARHAALLSVAGHRRLHRGDGHRSMAGYLRANCHASDAETARQRKIAALVDDHPTVGEALLAGYIGVSQVLEIARIHANPRTRQYLSTVVDLLLERAEHDTHRQLRELIDQFIIFADENGAFAEIERAVAGRNARVSVVGGELDVVAQGGDPLTADRLQLIFRRFVEAEFRKDVEQRAAEHGDDADGAPLPRTAAQRRFDAIVTIFDTAAAAEAPGVPAEPVVNIVSDEHTANSAFERAGIVLATGGVLDVDEAGEAAIREIIETAAADPTAWLTRRCHTADGTAVHPRLLLQAALTGHIRRVVVDSSGVVTDFGRTRRLFSGASRIAASILTSTCTHPGCNVPASQCEIDHVDEWCDGGPTDLANADIRCKPQNRFKHRARWRTRRDGRGRIHHLRPDGSIVLAVGQRPPDLSADELGRIAKRRLAEAVSRQRAAADPVINVRS